MTVLFDGDHEMYNNVDSPYPIPMTQPVKCHADDRRSAWLEVFPEAGMAGDLNVTWVEPGAILAWHRHQRQDDHMLVVQGALKVGLWQGTLNDETFGGPAHWVVEECRWVTLSDRNPQALVVPRGWWHGYQNIGTDRACVVTYITQKYDPEDEERLAPVRVNLSWERIAR